MRVLYIITKSDTGGAQTHLSQLSAFVERKGGQAAIMAHPGGWLQEYCEANGVTFYPNEHLSNSLNLILDIRAGLVVRKAVDDFSPDIVSTHSSKAGIVARLALRNSVPTLFTAHGWAFTDGTSLFRKTIALVFEKSAAPFCAKVICVSEKDHQLALRYKVVPEKKLRTIHNGVETDKPQATVKSTAKDVAFVARLAPPKNPFLLVEALAEVPQLTAHFIGGGPDQEKVQEKIVEACVSDRAILHGDVPREEVFQLLATMDASVLVSDYEGLPRSILEAMSAGLPIIASDVGGVRELVDERNGFVIGRHDKQELIDALTRLATQEGLAARLGRVSRERVEQEFSLSVMLAKTYAVYEEIFATK